MTPPPLGIETKGGVFTKLIERNTTIPTRKKSEIFTTAEDNQPSVEVHVLQGESEMALYNKTLGKFQLVGIPPAPRGLPQVEVAFDIDANGIIHVAAKDLGTGNEQQIKIEGGSGLKDDEVQRMIREAETHADEARKLRELADARNTAEALAYQTEKSLKEHRDKLDESVASTVEGRIMELRGVLESGDVAEIRAKSDVLQEAWSEAAQAIYAQASAAGPAGGDGDGTAPDDEVIEDADYEVVDDEAKTGQMDEPVEEQQEVDELEQLAKERDESLDALQRLEGRVRELQKKAFSERSGGVHGPSYGALRSNSCRRVLDDPERALVAASEHEEAKLEEGVELVHRALADALAREGLIEVDTEGEFDPHTQEALLAQPSDAKEGTVIQVLQKGYKLGDHAAARASGCVISGPWP